MISPRLLAGPCAYVRPETVMHTPDRRLFSGSLFSDQSAKLISIAEQRSVKIDFIISGRTVDSGLLYHP